MNVTEKNLMKRIEQELLLVLKASNEDKPVFCGDEFHEILAEVRKINAPRLTPVQTEVMKWVSQGWSLDQVGGLTFEINGKKVCNFDTVNALQKLGLIKKTGQWTWERV